MVHGTGRELEADNIVITDGIGSSTYADGDFNGTDRIGECGDLANGDGFRPRDAAADGQSGGKPTTSKTPQAANVSDSNYDASTMISTDNCIALDATAATLSNRRGRARPFTAALATKRRRIPTTKDRDDAATTALHCPTKAANATKQLATDADVVDASMSMSHDAAHDVVVASTSYDAAHGVGSGGVMEKSMTTPNSRPLRRVSTPKSNGSARKRVRISGASVPVSALLQLASTLTAVEETIKQDHLSVRLAGCRFGDHMHRTNCTNNPNCLFGLGERAEGVWGKDAVAMSSGDDPTQFTRDLKAMTPAGLGNLGATCYVNALLQTLFFNPAFRRIIYSYEKQPACTSLPAAMKDQAPPSLHCGENILLPFREMQRVFAHLQSGLRATHNLSNFCKLLGIQSHVQQDAQEFNKLLLNYLKQAFKGHLEYGSMKRLTGLFQGRQEYLTRCSACDTESRRPAEFLELDLPIAGLKTLQECVLTYFGTERMEGHNKYQCDKCKGKQEATRCTQLAKLPDVLNLQLMRFKFDPKTYQKKKTKDSIVFEKTLDFSAEEMLPLLAPELRKQVETAKAKGGDLRQFCFNLTAVLHHKGQTANSGHYTVDVLDRNKPGKETWWTLDDEMVKVTEGLLGRTAFLNAYMIVFEKQVFSMDDVDRNLPVALPADLARQVEDTNTAMKKEIDAFVHRQKAQKALALGRRAEYERIFKKQSPVAHNGNDKGAWVPTKWLRRWVVGLPLEVAAASAGGTKKAAADLAGRRTNQVVELLSDSEDPSKAASSKPACKVLDLTSGSDAETNQHQDPGLFNELPDTLSILCPHSNVTEGVLTLNPASIASFKLISHQTWNELLQAVGGSSTSSSNPTNPPTSTLEVLHIPNCVDTACPECTNKFVEYIRTERRNEDARLAILQIIEKPVIPFKPSSSELGELAVISSEWLSSWKKFTTKHAKQVLALVERINSGRSNNSSNSGPKKSAQQVTITELLANSKSSNSDEPGSNINASITCEHDGLSLGSRQKRLLRKEEFEFIRRTALRGSCMDPTTMFTYDADHQYCRKCEITNGIAQDVAVALKEEKDSQLRSKKHGAVLRSLKGSKSAHPSKRNGCLPAGVYYAVPHGWMCRWRAFLDIRNNECRPNESLMAACRRKLHCKCGANLMQLHPRAVSFLTRADSHLADSLLPSNDPGIHSDFASDYVELLSEKEFLALTSFYPDHDNSGLCRVTLNAPLLVEAGSRRTQDADKAGELVSFDPRLCGVCAAQNEAAFEHAQRFFSNENISIIVVKGDALNCLVECASSESLTARRTSRRPSRNTHQLKVSSDTNLLAIILTLIQNGTVPETISPASVKLFCAGKQLPDDQKSTLEECGIYAGAKVYVQVLGTTKGKIKDDSSIAEWISIMDDDNHDHRPGSNGSAGVQNNSGATSGAVAKEKEKGFAGSVLVGL